MTGDQVERIRLAASKSQAELPEHVAEFRAAVIVGHGGQKGYRRRLAKRLESALRQLPESGSGWIGFWWTNGAPLDVAIQVMETVEIPDHVQGVLFVGAGVIVPHAEIHYFTALASRDAESEAPWAFQSFEEHELVQDFGAIALGRFQSSSGLRPTLVAEPNEPELTPLMFRDGTRRIFPFNFLIDPDPAPEHGRWETIDGSG